MYVYKLKFYSYFKTYKFVKLNLKNINDTIEKTYHEKPRNVNFEAKFNNELNYKFNSTNSKKFLI